MGGIVIAVFGRLLRRRGHVSSEAAVVPETLVGRWLSAGVLREQERRRELSANLRATGWHDAAPVAKAAFEIVVREAYGPGWSAGPPEELAAGMRAFFGSDGVDRVPQAEAVRLIRAVCRKEVNVQDIPARVAFTVHGLVFVGLALDLGYDKSKLHAVLRQAEEIARGSGHSPTTASEITGGQPARGPRE